MQCPLVRAAILAALYRTRGTMNITAIAQGGDPEVKTIVECTGRECGYWNNDFKVCGQSIPTEAKHA